MSHRGQAITTLDHAKRWCIDEHKPVLMIGKKGKNCVVHKWKVVASMSFKGLLAATKEGRLFEYHI